MKRDDAKRLDDLEAARGRAGAIGKAGRRLLGPAGMALEAYDQFSDPNQSNLEAGLRTAGPRVVPPPEERPLELSALEQW